ncbi:MAG: hypothetical protein MHM6MM_006264 [Cercozoa sp. M6MM]
MSAFATAPGREKVRRSREQAALAALEPKLQRSFRGHSQAARCVSFNPNLKQIASGGDDGLVMVWNFKPSLRAFKFNGHTAPVTAVQYTDYAWRGSSERASADQVLLASASRDGEIRLWQPRVTGKSRVVRAHLSPINDLDVHSATTGGELHLCTASDDKTVKLWTAASDGGGGELRFRRTLRGHTHWVSSAALSPDTLLALSGAHDKTVKLWDAHNAQCVQTFRQHDAPVRCVRFHPDGSLVAACGDDGSVKVWDVRSGKLLQHYDAHTGSVNGIAFHASGAFLLSVGDDSAIKAWDLAEGRLLYTIEAHTDAVRGAAFSPHGDYFATAGQDKLVLVWQTCFDRKYQNMLRGRTGSASYSNAKKPSQRKLSKATKAQSTLAGEETLKSDDKQVQAAQSQCDQTDKRNMVVQARVTASSSPRGKLSEDSIVQVLRSLTERLDLVTTALSSLDQRLAIQEEKMLALAPPHTRTAHVPTPAAAAAAATGDSSISELQIRVDSPDATVEFHVPRQHTADSQSFLSSSQSSLCTSTTSEVSTPTTSEVSDAAAFH